MMLTHFNDFWGQKLTEYISFWSQKSLKWVSKETVIRRYPEITLVATGGGGVSQKLTLANRGRRGVKEKVILEY